MNPLVDIATDTLDKGRSKKMDTILYAKFSVGGVHLSQKKNFSSLAFLLKRFWKPLKFSKNHQIFEKRSHFLQANEITMTSSKNIAFYNKKF